jgi:hypothetical protein
VVVGSSGDGVAGAGVWRQDVLATELFGGVL